MSESKREETGKVYVRRADEADFQLVTDINQHLYDGLDYLPAEYHKLLKQGAVYFVALDDNHQVVGFVFYMWSTPAPTKHLTLYRGGLRVSPRLMGQGVGRCLMEESFDHLTLQNKRNRRRPAFVTWIIVDDRGPEKLQLAGQRVNIIHTSIIHAYLVNKDILTNLVIHSKTSSTKCIEPDDLNNIDMKSSLFGRGDYFLYGHTWFIDNISVDAIKRAMKSAKTIATFHEHFICSRSFFSYSYNLEYHPPNFPLIEMWHYCSTHEHFTEHFVTGVKYGMLELERSCKSQLPQTTALKIHFMDAPAMEQTMKYLKAKLGERYDRQPFDHKTTFALKRDMTVSRM